MWGWVSVSSTNNILVFILCVQAGFGAQSVPSPEAPGAIYPGLKPKRF